MHFKRFFTSWHAVKSHLQQEVKTEALRMLLLRLPRPQQEPLRRQVTSFQHPFFPATLLYLCQHVHSARVQPQCRSSVRDDRGCSCILLYSDQRKEWQTKGRSKFIVVSNVIVVPWGSPELAERAGGRGVRLTWGCSRWWTEQPTAGRSAARRSECHGRCWG